MNTTIKKIAGIVIAILSVAAFYLAGKALDIDVAAEFAPYIATALILWIVYIGKKWFGLKLDFLNNEIVKGKVIEAIIYAEGKAVEKFKLDRVITDGKKKAKKAVAKLLSSLPNLTEEEASALIENYFPQVRPTLERMWFELSEEFKAKNELKNLPLS